MFIYSIKGHNLKLIGVLTLSVFLIALTVILLPSQLHDQEYPAGVLPTVKTMEASDFKNVKTNEDRIAFLRKYGWEVEPEAREVIEVTIPNEFDPILIEYNELQKAEGLDLEKYKGKSVKRYTYLVINYDYEGSVLANMILYDDRVIGGDICSAKQDGFVHGFSKGNDFLTKS